MRMKDSGIDWIGEIPEHWEVVHMKRVLSFNNGRDYKNIEASEGYPVLGSGGQFTNASEYLYDGEAILFGRKGTIDKPMYINGKFWTVDTMFYAVPKTNSFAKYLFYQAKAIPLDRYSTQTALPSMTQTGLQNILICLPPLIEQRAIATYLDDKCAKIDRQVEVLGAKRDAYLRLKKSIINRAVTKGLNPNVKTKDSGIDWIGEIPEHWEMKRMKDCVSLIKGRTPGEMTFDVIGSPYLTMDYLRDREGKDVMYPLNPEGLLKVEDSEILVLWDGANAGEFIFSKEGYLSSTMAVIKHKRNTIIKKYLYYLLKVIETDSKYYANGTTIPHFDGKTIFTREYPTPPLSEQRAIANYLDDKCTKIDAIVGNIDNQIEKYKELKRSLIDEVVTGRRVVEPSNQA